MHTSPLSGICPTAEPDGGGASARAAPPLGAGKVGAALTWAVASSFAAWPSRVACAASSVWGASSLRGPLVASEGSVPCSRCAEDGRHSQRVGVGMPLPVPWGIGWPLSHGGSCPKVRGVHAGNWGQKEDVCPPAAPEVCSVRSSGPPHVCGHQHSQIGSEVTSAVSPRRPVGRGAISRSCQGPRGPRAGVWGVCVC